MDVLHQGRDAFRELVRVWLRHPGGIAVASEGDALLDDEGAVAHVTHARGHQRVGDAADGGGVVVAAEDVPAAQPPSRGRGRGRGS